MGPGFRHRKPATTTPAPMIAAETAKAVPNPFVATAPPKPGPSAIPRYRAEVYTRTPARGSSAGWNPPRGTSSRGRSRRAPPRRKGRSARRAGESGQRAERGRSGRRSHPGKDETLAPEAVGHEPQREGEGGGRQHEAGVDHSDVDGGGSQPPREQRDQGSRM